MPENTDMKTTPESTIAPPKVHIPTDNETFTLDQFNQALEKCAELAQKNADLTQENTELRNAFHQTHDGKLLLPWMPCWTRIGTRAKVQYVPVFNVSVLDADGKSYRQCTPYDVFSFDPTEPKGGAK
jgi:hypothetical protein